MTTANCPRCSEQVTVPDSASREATVCCPFCSEEYSLDEALAQLPPSLIVVSDFAAEPAAADDQGSPWAALNLDDDDADGVAMVSTDGDSPAAALDFTGGAVTSGAATSGGKSRAAVRPSSRSRKPKGSPIKSVLSIVVGGLMAFPIAQLILWYLPGEWKRDFGAGPIVAQYLPQIVPAKFRGNGADAESNSESAAPGAGSVIPDFNSGGGEFASAAASGGLNAGDRRENANNAKKKKQKTNDVATSIEQPAAEQQLSTEDAAAAGADVFGTPLEVPGLELGAFPSLDAPDELPDAIAKVIDEPASQPPSTEDGLPTIEPPEPQVAGLAPGNIRNAPQITAEHVSQSVQAAVTGNAAWDSDEATSPSTTVKREFYLSFSKLGEALTFADRSDEDVVTQMTETVSLLNEIGKQPEKLAVIRGVAKGWIAAGHEARKTDGICLSGVVTSVKPIGNFYETVVEAGDQQIPVVSTSDPSEHFAADRQVLILGTILDDPAKNLGGYEGSREVVVLDGFHVNIPDE